MRLINTEKIVDGVFLHTFEDCMLPDLFDYFEVNSVPWFLISEEDIGRLTCKVYIFPTQELYLEYQSEVTPQIFDNGVPIS